MTNTLPAGPVVQLRRRGLTWQAEENGFPRREAQRLAFWCWRAYQRGEGPDRIVRPQLGGRSDAQQSTPPADD